MGSGCESGSTYAKVRGMNEKIKPPDIELRPDGWEQFERAVDAAVKGGPRHRPAKQRPASKGRVRKGKSRA